MKVKAVGETKADFGEKALDLNYKGKNVAGDPSHIICLEKRNQAQQAQMDLHFNLQFLHMHCSLSGGHVLHKLHQLFDFVSGYHPEP